MRLFSLYIILLLVASFCLQSLGLQIDRRAQRHFLSRSEPEKIESQTESVLEDLEEARNSTPEDLVGTVSGGPHEDTSEQTIDKALAIATKNIPADEIAEINENLTPEDIIKALTETIEELPESQINEEKLEEPNVTEITEEWPGIQLETRREDGNEQISDKQSNYECLTPQEISHAIDVAISTSEVEQIIETVSQIDTEQALEVFEEEEEGPSEQVNNSLSPAGNEDECLTAADLAETVEETLANSKAMQEAEEIAAEKALEVIVVTVDGL